MSKIDSREARERLGGVLMMMRCGRNLFQREVTTYTGIPRSKISEYERGVHVPSNGNLEKLLNCYGYRIESRWDGITIKRYWLEAKLELTRIRRK